MYTNLGYIVYRTVLEYYAGDVDEDAYGKRSEIPIYWAYLHSVNFGFVSHDPQTDMRKALSRDVNKTSVVPLKHPVRCDEVD